MITAGFMDTLFGEESLFKAGYDYMVDSTQKSVLFMDTLRKRGNQYLEHLENGQPPVLVFDYDIIVDGRTLEKPANYALALIHDRRSRDDSATREKRKKPGLKSKGIDPLKRPMVIIDPRAGHGPGIGGSKQDSEIGLALSMGHPVYFVLFFTDPMPGQTLADVKNAEIVFLEEVKKRHPDAPRPTVIGNCQGGWGGALVGADRPDLVGPLLLNGSPLSYWSGIGGTNPMRYKGGLLGGVWVNSFMGDLGNGVFDGANLVLNMELLNPGNTFWSKEYNLYSKIDTEEDRYLNFEKWWGGFYMMTTDEIHKIVSGLFIGNQLARGVFELEEGKKLDLTHFNDPVVVFASEGDNITPPQQALNWIPMVYKSVEEIRRHGQVIVYIVHPKIGHLGIFVATSIAKKEQKNIIGSVEMIEYLSPGLYEMVIVEEPSEPWLNDYKVIFEERTIKDILAFDDGTDDEEAFKHVAVLSELNDKFYQAFLRPLVKSVVTETSAEIMKQMHPLRTQRYMISDINPLMVPVKTMAPHIRENRHKTDDDNVFLQLEKMVSKSIVDTWNLYSDIRDTLHERAFYKLYTNPIMEFMFPDKIDLDETPEKIKQDKKDLAVAKREDKKQWMDALEEGGYTHGVIRMMIAMAEVDGSFDVAEIKVAAKIVKNQNRLKNLSAEELRRISKEQSRILQTDREKALNALPKMITTKRDKDRALKFAKQIAFADQVMDVKEKALLKKLESILYPKK